MANLEKKPPYLGIALMASGGIFLVFLILQFQGMSLHERHFSKLCGKVARAHKIDSKKEGIYCDWIRKTYIKNRAPISLASVEDLQALPMAHDDYSRIVITQDPSYFSGLAYCYFQ